MKNQVVLFGAGSNCKAVIRFLGKENIYTIIDNDVHRWGTQLDEINIISLMDFLDETMNFPVLITITSANDREVVKEQLKAAGIREYYFAPFIQFGFYKSVNDLIYMLEMDKHKPVFYGNNPITDKITEELKRQKISYNILDTKEEDYAVLGREKELEYLINDSEIMPETRLFVTDDKTHDLSHLTCKVINVLEEYRKNYLPVHNELKKFKDIHKGKRCFLIGNGPSLSFDDLEVLKVHKEITFGVNRIYLSFDKTNWRPDYFVIADSLMIQQDSHIIQNYQFPVAFIGDNYRDDIITNDKYFYFSRMPNGYENFSLDITKYIYGGGTVIYDAMQIAAYMGFCEIILLGVDMTPIKDGKATPHFYTENQTKNGYLKRGDTVSPMKSFSTARAVMEKKGVKLVNATRGGSVEVLDRVSFDELF